MTFSNASRVMIFEGFHQLEHLSRVAAFQLLIFLRDVFNFGYLGFDPGFFDRFKDGIEIRRCGDDFKVVLVITQVISAGFNR